MKKIPVLILTAVTLLTLSCSKTDETSTDDSTTVTPVVENPTYTTNIKPLVDNYCITCHSGASPSASLSLTNYDEVKASASSGKLVTRLKDTANPMPPSGVLPDETVALFEEWVNDGMPE